MMPSPIVMASALARRTHRVKICILGSALPLRQHPLTLAEEHAMIDTLTRGRLITGFVRGIGAEYHVFGVDPTTSHERFHEAHDLIIRAWTETGPFEFSGKHYKHRYVNTWPRPYQQPHPPVWIPSQGSQETIDFASHPERRYTYLQTFSPAAAVKKYLDLYRVPVPRNTATRPPTASSAGRCRSMSARPTKARWPKPGCISRISATISRGCRSKCCCRPAIPRARR